MSDLRNPYGSDLSDIKIVEPVDHVEPTIYTQSIREMEMGNHVEPLGAFHTIEVEETSSTGRIVGGLAIALMVGAAAVYGYEVSVNSQAVKPVVTQTAVNTPAPAPALMAPPAQSADATQTAPLPSEAATPSVSPSESSSPPAAAPVKKAPVRATRSVAQRESWAPALSAGVPEQSAAVQPVYPTAPASSLATNNNQSVVTPEMPDTAPAVPEVTPAPVPDAAPVQAVPEQAAQPAPDQSAEPAQ